MPNCATRNHNIAKLLTHPNKNKKLTNKNYLLKQSIHISTLTGKTVDINKSLYAFKHGGSKRTKTKNNYLYCFYYLYIWKTSLIETIIPQKQYIVK